MELVIKETLEKFLNALGIPYTGVKTTKESDETYYAEIETENSSLLIGWHGETRKIQLFVPTVVCFLVSYCSRLL